VTSAPETAVASASAAELYNVTKHFGTMLALRGVSLALEPGKLVLLLGENGAGKSTLLRVIAGLTVPTHGTVSIFGSADRQLSKKRLGYMPHASLLYDELTGLENLEYFATLYGVRDVAVSQRAMQQVGLDPSLRRRVGQYSQGMRQRLSLARAILHDPDLLLLDEPFSNVDVASARQIAERLAAMRDAGKTLLVVTHQPQVLDCVADEAVFLVKGRVVDQRGWNAEAMRVFEGHTLATQMQAEGM
jgi:ABC-type multidrug transport system ATPase subunit